MVCSNFWKLDKIDKIGISLILILFCLFSIFDCFCYASSELPYTYLNNIGTVDGVYTPIGGCIGKVYQIKPNFIYKIINRNLDGCRVIISEGYPSVNLPITDTFVVPAESEHEFTNNTDNYLYVFYYFPSSQESSSVDNISLHYVNGTGYSGAIYNLYNSMNISEIWSSFSSSLPFVLIVVLFSFGWWFFAHWVKELSKGREF